MFLVQYVTGRFLMCIGNINIWEPAIHKAKFTPTVRNMHRAFGKHNKILGTYH